MIARMLAEEGPVPLLEFPASPIADRFSLFRVAPRVLIDNAASAAYTVIEVNGRDRRGFLDTVAPIPIDDEALLSVELSPIEDAAVDAHEHGGGACMPEHAPSGPVWSRIELLRAYEPKRRHLLEGWHVVLWRGFELDGLCFASSGELELVGLTIGEILQIGAG